MNRFSWVALLGVTVVLAAAARCPAAEYAKPELLIDYPTLAEMLGADEPAVVVLDVRSAGAFAAGAIPSAKRVDARAWKAAFDAGRDTKAWGERIGDLTIDANKTVVVYDTATSPTATRLWWLLKYWGVADVRVLDGGYSAWAAPPGSINTQAAATPTGFTAVAQPERLATRGEVLRAVAADSAGPACLVDTRSEREVAAGAIPGSVHSDWARYVDPKTGKLRPAGELQALLDEAGFVPTAGAITYCRTGGRASFVAFVMELMGGKPSANYWGSWNEWSRENGGRHAAGQPNE